VAVTVAVGHLRYHEVEELRAGVKRTVGDRRARVANNIRVRRASLAISKATTFSELFEAVREMLEFEEFAYANVQLGKPWRAELNQRAFKATHQRAPLQRIELRNGLIVWSWTQDGVNEDEIIGSGNFWCFRLPLSTKSGEWGWMNLYRQLDAPPLLLDMNYLAGFLRTELAEAAERIFQSFEEPVSAGQVPLTMTAGKITG
jgi:hypothetical protein